MSRNRKNKNTKQKLAKREELKELIKEQKRDNTMLVTKLYIYKRPWKRREVP